MANTSVKEVRFEEVAASVQEVPNEEHADAFTSTCQRTSTPKKAASSPREVCNQYEFFVKTLYKESDDESSSHVTLAESEKLDNTQEISGSSHCKKQGYVGFPLMESRYEDLDSSLSIRDSYLANPWTELQLENLYPEFVNKQNFNNSGSFCIESKV